MILEKPWTNLNEGVDFVNLYQSPSAKTLIISTTDQHRYHLGLRTMFIEVQPENLIRYMLGEKSSDS